MERTPGWYGKLPVLGDFASRRLPTGLVATWDAWLQSGMAQSHLALGDAWLDAYLTSPVWHFLIGQGVADEQMWSGVMLPSVDRVGRYFPLTVCACLPGLAFASEGVAALEQWLEKLESTARSGLDPDTSLDSFESALGNCLAPHGAEPLAASTSLARALHQRVPFAHFETAPGTGFQTLITQAGAAAAGKLMRGYSLWWCHSELAALGGFACQGLPDAQVFSRMMQYAPGAGA